MALLEGLKGAVPAGRVAPPSPLSPEVPYRLVQGGPLGSVSARLAPTPAPGTDLLGDLVALSGDALPTGAPPVYATRKEDMSGELAERFLGSLDDLPVNSVRQAQRYWKREPKPQRLFEVQPSAATAEIGVVKDPITGNPTGFCEELRAGLDTSDTSLSMSRRPGSKSAFTFGLSTNMPFQPGGLDLQGRGKGGAGEDEAGDEDPFATLLAVPPGFERGLEILDMAGDDPMSAELEPSGPPQGGGAAAAPIPALPVAAGASAGEETKTSSEIISVSALFDAVDLPAPADTSAPDASGDEDDASGVDEVLSHQQVTLQATDEQKATKDTERWAINIDCSVPVIDFHKQVPHMAYSWPFELDVFQKQAVMRLERHESVFVAAHTSAGKTVVAEYAIALCAKHMTRCIYTSPIKALSNQKFRDFRTTFEDVGLLTGDVQIRADASCLIMTTEILRSMLYRGADLVRDVEWVVFDEVHYINDAERGVVWEEVIIMLPKHVNIVLLSATVPNTFEFADWVGRTKKKPVYVVSTPKRPVPLEHFLYTGDSGKTSSEMFKIVDSGKTFLSAGYKAAVAAKTGRKKQNKFGPKGGYRGGGIDKTMYVSFVKMLKKKGLMPTVVFTFSKKRCESNADSLSGEDLTSSKEKSEIRVFIDQSVSRLKGTDKFLPQVTRMRDLLSRGVGVHHGGLLPILKEVVELLFSRGLVKILYATETFAMGVNMPARCVVFDTTRKFDGEKMRDLLPGEYIQMAGRAGRRGLDATGTVIILCKGDVQDVGSLKEMMLGRPTRLESRFRLTYNMILNLLRVEELRVEDMMKRSFSEFHTQRDASQNKAELSAKEEQLEAYGDSGCPPDLPAFYDVNQRVLALNHQIQSEILSTNQGLKKLGPGRVVVVNNATYRNALAVVLRLEHTRTTKEHKATVLVVKEADPSLQTAINETVLPVNRLFTPHGPLGFDVTSINAMDIICITKQELKISVLTLLDRPDPAEQSATAQQLLRIAEKYPDALPPAVHPLKDLKINRLEFVENFKAQQRLSEELRSFECTKSPELKAQYAKYHERRTLTEKIQSLRHKLSDESLHLLPEYNQRVEVLKHLNYVDTSNAVQLKGRVACEISTCDEILVTELLFENVFKDFEPAEIVALLSSMVFQERRVECPKLPPKLDGGVEALKSVAARIAEVQLLCGMSTPVDVYVEELHFGLVEVVHQWALGVPFAEITDLTEVLEGSIVRCIVRLDETCRDVRNAARVIGDPVLYQKMDEASAMIKRDIVFAASLYTT